MIGDSLSGWVADPNDIYDPAKPEYPSYVHLNQHAWPLLLGLTLDWKGGRALHHSYAVPQGNIILALGSVNVIANDSPAMFESRLTATIGRVAGDLICVLPSGAGRPYIDIIKSMGVEWVDYVSGSWSDGLHFTAEDHIRQALLVMSKLQDSN